MIEGKNNPDENSNPKKEGRDLGNKETRRIDVEYVLSGRPGQRINSKEVEKDG